MRLVVQTLMFNNSFININAYCSKYCFCPSILQVLLYLIPMQTITNMMSKSRGIAKIILYILTGTGTMVHIHILGMLYLISKANGKSGDGNMVKVFIT